jgi:hypothetical protein
MVGTMAAAAAAVVRRENMNARIVALNFPIKPQWIGICYFVEPWRIYDVAVVAAAAAVVYRSRHVQTLPTMH